MNISKHLIYIIIWLISLQQISYSSPSPPKTVNIITKHYYLHSPKIASIVKNKCGVNIHYDEYYSANECLRRMTTTIDLNYHHRITTNNNIDYYDIAIFPSDIYPLIKKKISTHKSTLNHTAQNYYNDFKNHYLAGNYPNNIAYFTIGYTGFIWNPEAIKLHPFDSLKAIFVKANNKTVIIIDSTAGTWNLLDNEHKLSLNSLVIIFRKLTKHTDTYITNGYNKLYHQDNFAFAFQQSGEALLTIKTTTNKNLKFLLHPTFSYLTPDLIAELNNRPETICAAKVLSSPEVLDIVQKETYYLSPYGTFKTVDDPMFQGVYEQLFNAPTPIRWIESFHSGDAKEFNELRYMWDNIHRLPQIQKNHALILKNY